MRQLTAQLLADEIRARFGPVSAVGCHAAAEVAEEGTLGVEEAGVRVVSVDAKAAFFVDVAIAHGDDDGVDGDVHHNYVEDEQADAELADGNYVESLASDGESLK